MMVRLFDMTIPPFNRYQLPVVHPFFAHQFHRLKRTIIKTIGQFISMQLKPYFIYQQRYIQLLFIGSRGRFNLTLNVTGQTHFPDLSPKSPKLRYYMEVIDEFDAYHLIDMLNHLLREEDTAKLSTKSVDNTVDKGLL
ncbi:hypothetical protein [Gallibacterium anatis]|uniref:hypothetical protein n=1 Tax=Gallibacterium anatis TaxID=750 RepID=UPI00080282E4|nr:hypothetical protein [Gallibacterium anatis]